MTVEAHSLRREPCPYGHLLVGNGSSGMVVMSEDLGRVVRDAEVLMGVHDVRHTPGCAVHFSAEDTVAVPAHAVLQNP